MRGEEGVSRCYLERNMARLSLQTYGGWRMKASASMLFAMRTGKRMPLCGGDIALYDLPQHARATARDQAVLGRTTRPEAAETLQAQAQKFLLGKDGRVFAAKSTRIMEMMLQITSPLPRAKSSPRGGLSPSSHYSQSDDDGETPVSEIKTAKAGGANGLRLREEGWQDMAESLGGMAFWIFAGAVMAMGVSGTMTDMGEAALNMMQNPILIATGTFSAVSLAGILGLTDTAGGRVLVGGGLLATVWQVSNFLSTPIQVDPGAAANVALLAEGTPVPVPIIGPAASESIRLPMLLTTIMVSVGYAMMRVITRGTPWQPGRMNGVGLMDAIIATATIWMLYRSLPGVYGSPDTPMAPVTMSMDTTARYSAEAHARFPVLESVANQSFGIVVMGSVLATGAAATIGPRFGWRASTSALLGLAGSLGYVMQQGGIDTTAAFGMNFLYAILNLVYSLVSGIFIVGILLSFLSR